MMHNVTITTAQYVQDEEGNNAQVFATLNGVERLVPMDSDNSDYQAILDWVADGNTIQDAS